MKISLLIVFSRESLTNISRLRKVSTSNFHIENS